MPGLHSTLPILSLCAAAEFEERLFQGDAEKEWKAMQAAGRAVAQALKEEFRVLTPTMPQHLRVLVLAGHGHNAGDAFLSLQELVALAKVERLEVVVLFLSGRDLRPLAQRAFEGLSALSQVSVIPVEWQDGPPSALTQAPFDLCLDGLLGSGFRPPLRDPVPAALRWANEAHSHLRLRVALDLPSGISDEPSPLAFHADVTFSLGIPKAAVFSPLNATPVGRLRFLDLGFFGDQRPEATEFMVADTLCRRLNVPRPGASDKRAYGHVVVLAGSPFMAGAALMTTKAALRSGAGLVTTCLPGPAHALIAGHAPEAMWQPLAIKPDGSLADDAVRMMRVLSENASALVMGPGLVVDRNTQFLLSRIIRENTLPLVLDASALAPDVINAVVGRHSTAGPVIITPHLGEYNRLLNRRTGDYQADEFLDYCRRHRVTAILKGPITRVCDGQSLLHVPTGGPVLARGGSGDILAGMLGTLLAQHPTRPLLAALLGVSWHGRAAQLLAGARGEHAVTTTELLDYLAPALREA